MTKEERHSEIMDNLLKQGSIQVTELADNLQVSSVTIRTPYQFGERGQALPQPRQGDTHKPLHQQPHGDGEGEAQHG